jgi:two-component system sensor histidine kinase DesK
VTALDQGLAGLSPLTGERARWLLVAVHLPVAVIPVWFTVFGVAGEVAWHGYLALFLGPSMLALQLRHSFTAARDLRPRGWPWTLLALVLLAGVPLAVLPGWSATWAVAKLFPLASVLMLMRGSVRVVVFILLAALAMVQFVTDPPGLFGYVYPVTYGIATLIVAVVLYAAVRLVRVVDELHLVRSELAEVAVGRERLRFARDLHDLLGQSLSAIALKGDLALRLLRRDPEAARTEVRDMTILARDTLHGMRAVARDEHAVSLAREADGAAALLAAAGITPTVDVSSAGLADTTQEMFAWAVREGVTNILRHSDARICSITVARHDGHARLTIVSDGARPPVQSGDGTGLTGLADRAAALSGSVTADRGGGDLFHLVVEIPEEAT